MASRSLTKTTYNKHFGGTFWPRQYQSINPDGVRHVTVILTPDVRTPPR